MRWVTVASEEGPRACGVVNGEYVDVNAADPEMPATVRELLELGPDWQRRAWAALAHGSRPARSRPRDAAGAGARPPQDRLHRAELSRPRRRERRAGADRAGALQQVPDGLDRPRCADRLAQGEPARSTTRPSWWW